MTKFSIMAKVTVDVTIEVRAKDLNDAVNVTKDLKLDDFVETNGELLDSELRITGVFES